MAIFSAILYRRRWLHWSKVRPISDIKRHRATGLKMLAILKSQTAGLGQVLHCEILLVKLSLAGNFFSI